MMNNKSPRKSQDPDAAWVATARELKAEGTKWDTALAIAGYNIVQRRPPNTTPLVRFRDWEVFPAEASSGDNIVQLRPQNTTPVLAAAMGYALFHGWKVFPANLEDGEKKSYLSAEYAPDTGPGA